jgi:hypothetical protein
MFPFIVVGVGVAASNIKLFNVAMEVQLCTVVELQNISYCCLQ